MSQVSFTFFFGPEWLQYLLQSLSWHLHCSSFFRPSMDFFLVFPSHVFLSDSDFHSWGPSQVEETLKFYRAQGTVPGTREFQLIPSPEHGRISFHFPLTSQRVHTYWACLIPHTPESDTVLGKLPSVCMASSCMETCGIYFSHFWNSIFAASALP